MAAKVPWEPGENIDELALRPRRARKLLRRRDCCDKGKLHGINGTWEIFTSPIGLENHEVSE